MPVPQLPVDMPSAATATEGPLCANAQTKVVANVNEGPIHDTKHIKNIAPGAPAAGITVFRLTDPSHKATMEEVKLLAEEYFQEDFNLCVSVSANSWRVDAALCNETKRLAGFVVYRRRAKTRDVGISKVYVQEAFRRQGIGRRLVKNVLEFAKKDKAIEVVSLCAFPHAVKFYQGLKFKALSHTEGDEIHSEQTYMEHRVRAVRRGR